MKVLRIVSAVLLLGAVAAVAFVQKDQPYTPHGFQIIYQEKHVRGDKVLVKYISTRLVSASGFFKEMKAAVGEGVKGDKVVVSAKNGDYVQDGQGVHVTGASTPASGSEAYNPATYKHHPELNRVEQLFGYKAYVLRSSMGDTDYVEQWVVPQFGRAPVKLYVHHENEDVIFDPISLEFADVTDEMITVPDGPVLTDFLERRIADLEQRGERKQADALRTVLRNQ